MRSSSSPPSSPPPASLTSSLMDVLRRPVLLSNRQTIRPSLALAATVPVLSASSHRFDIYQKAVERHCNTERRSALNLARATRRALAAEKQLAELRIQEAEALVELLRDIAQTTAIREEHATSQESDQEGVPEPSLPEPPVDTSFSDEQSDDSQVLEDTIGIIGPVLRDALTVEALSEHNRVHGPMQAN